MAKTITVFFLDHGSPVIFGICWLATQSITVFVKSLTIGIKNSLHNCHSHHISLKVTIFTGSTHSNPRKQNIPTK